MVLTPLDFMFLKGWDWDFKIKAKTLSPGGKFEDRAFILKGHIYPLTISMLSENDVGSDDSSETIMKVQYDSGKPIQTSPLEVRNAAGLLDVWTPAYAFITWWDSLGLGRAYGLAICPSYPTPTHKELKISAEHPAALTADSAVTLFVYYWKIIDMKKFVDSLNKLIKGEVEYLPE